MTANHPPSVSAAITEDPLAMSRALLERAARTTPGGVHSNVRLHERPLPLFLESAEGPHLVDVDGNRYIDFVMGQGPMLLGHRPAGVLRAVTEQLERGVIYAGQHRLEVEAAELVRDLVPCAEQVRFNVTGTEAVQAALRLARATTGRSMIAQVPGSLPRLGGQRGLQPRHAGRAGRRRVVSSRGVPRRAGQPRRRPAGRGVERCRGL